MTKLGAIRNRGCKEKKKVKKKIEFLYGQSVTWVFSEWKMAKSS